MAAPRHGGCVQPKSWLARIPIIDTEGRTVTCRASCSRAEIANPF
jgi:hypothetical protein